MDQLIERIFQVERRNFEELSLEVFKIQYKNNPVYREFVDLVRNKDITKFRDIPFLPIQFFKSHKVVSGVFEASIVFKSSGTTRSTRSRHFILDPSVYQRSFLKHFKRQYTLSNTPILALLPSYLEAGDSSLVYMVDHLIKASNNSFSGFFLRDLDALNETLIEVKRRGQRPILFGVTYALLEFLERYNFKDFNQLTVIETGGMKGRREEITREQLHTELIKGFGTKSVHSEYGMTELLSQAYATDKGIFVGPNWFEVAIRNPYDPFDVNYNEGRGAVNIVDLANIHSCSFIATDDLGKLHADGSFEILGRIDHSDIRGCNLLM